MFNDFSFVELLLYLLVWAALGGLPGFYLYYTLNRNPRHGAVLGALVGIGVGLVIGIGELTESPGQMFNAIVLLWLVTLATGTVARLTNTGMGTYRDTASINAATANLAYGLLMPTLLIVSTIVVFPMIWNLVLAFRPVRLRNLPDLQIFSLDGLTLDNFNTVFRNSDRFFDVFWPAAFDTLILLAILAAGWYIGKALARQMKREPGNGALVGLLVAIVVAFIIAGVRDYSDALNDLITGRGFLNTLLRTFIYTIAGTALAIILGLIAALVVKDEFRGRNIVRGFMLFPYIAPIVSVVFIWKLLLNAQFGLVNEVIDAAGGQRTDFLTTPGTAFLLIILFQGWRYFPFAFLFILARIQAIPDDMYEAAKVDGAAPSQRLWFITLPQLRAVFGTLAVLRFIWTFNKFDDVFLLTGGAASTQLVTIEIYDQLFSRSNIGTASAVAMVLAVVLFIVVGIYFRWFMVEDS